MITGLDYSLKAKLAIDEDRLYNRWLSERQYIKESRYRDSFKDYLELFRPKPVVKEDKDLIKARIDKEVMAIENKLLKGGVE